MTWVLVKNKIKKNLIAWIRLNSPQFSSTNTQPRYCPFLSFPIFNPIYGMLAAGIPMFGDGAGFVLKGVRIKGWGLD